MPRKQPKTELTPEEELVLAHGLEGAEVEDDSPYVNPAGGGGEAAAPAMWDPKWSDFVRSKFTDDEVDDEGNPFVHGLRRVTRQLIGPIINSEVKVVASPGVIPGSPYLSPAVAEHEVTVMHAYNDYGLDPFPVSCREVGSVIFLDGVRNTDTEFARFAIETASTRAEARALRKLLQLKKVIAAEERTLVPLEDGFAKGLITDSQKAVLTLMTRQLKIDLTKYINSGRDKYDGLDDVPYGKALSMIDHLHKYKADKNLIPKEIKL